MNLLLRLTLTFLLNSHWLLYWLLVINRVLYQKLSTINLIRWMLLGTTMGDEK